MLYQGLFPHAEGTEVSRAQHKRPSSINNLARFIQCTAGSKGDLPASCKKHMEAHGVLCPLGPQYNWLLSILSPTEILKGPTSSSHDTSKLMLTIPGWLEECKETLPGPACSIFWLLAGGGLSSHGLGTENRNPSGIIGQDIIRKHLLMLWKTASP